jgi:2'-5' RNA ligase
LQDHRLALGDDSAAQIPTHITLLPPYEAEHAEVDAVTTYLGGVARIMPPFRIHLRGTGTFRPVSPVVFVNVVEGIAQCEQLADAVRRGPLVTEFRFPYHPHVTVAHDLDEDALERAFVELGDFDCVFEVGEFWLYLHDEETGWMPTRAFPLGLSAQEDGVKSRT